MLKISFKYDYFTGQDYKGIEVLVYNSEPSLDGTHICASAVFHAGMLSTLSNEAVQSLIDSLVPAIEVCNANVQERIERENNSIK